MTTSTAHHSSPQGCSFDHADPCERFRAMHERVQHIDQALADLSVAKDHAERNLAVARAMVNARRSMGQTATLDEMDDPAAIANRIASLKIEREGIQGLMTSLSASLAYDYDRAYRDELSKVIAECHDRQREMIRDLCKMLLHNGAPVDELPARVPAMWAAAEGFEIERRSVGRRLRAVTARYPVAAIMSVVEPGTPTFPGKQDLRTPPPTPAALGNYRWALPPEARSKVIKECMAEAGGE